MKILNKILLVLVVSLTTFAQTIYFNEDSTMAAFWNNRLYFPFDNKGVLGDVNVGPNGSLIRYDSTVVAFSGGFALSGIISDTTVWANGVISASPFEDYLSGQVDSQPDNKKNKIYFIQSSDPDFGESWYEWRKAVEQGAYYYDGNENGVYDPIDLNSNGVWDNTEDKPDILYDLNAFCVYNDGVPSSERKFSEINPLGIEIRQSIFVSNQNTILDDVVFVRYSLLYRGIGILNEPDSLKEIIFSIATDPDIGNHVDDLVGSDTLLNSAFAYQPAERSDNQFGINAPALFKVIVQGPRIKTNNLSDFAHNKLGPNLDELFYQGYINGNLKAFFHNQGGDPDLSSPKNPTELRNYAMGLHKTGIPADPCNWPYGYVIGNLDCASINPHFLYSGNPVSQFGWLNKTPTEQHDLTSTGRFTLIKNEPMDIIVAYVVGRGTDALNSITRAREITQYVHEEYERNFSTITGVEDQPEEVINEFSLSQNYPNPFNPTTTIKFTIPTSPFHPSPYQGEGPRERLTKLIVYNILGQQVKTLVNEVKSPGNYEVNFDASQLASGVYFYRLTSGSLIQTKKMMVLK